MTDWIVVTDFDGTVVRKDLAELILRRFGRKGWEKYDDLAAIGRMTIEDCMKIQFQMIEARNEEELLQFIRSESKFRPGFKELLVTCKDKGVPLVIVTAGIDFCINYVFKLNGVKSPPKIVCANTKFTNNGIRVTFPRYFETLKGCTNFKEAFVARHRKNKDNVVYVGDGQSDYWPALISDKVFAIRGSALERLLRKEGVAHESVSSMMKIEKFVRELE
jgi:2-hydroxy-3-keto-5-methylthiopentenyl-1-phosphate phosphatase